MKCLFDQNRVCPLTKHNIPIVKLGRFCQACIGRAEMRKAMKSMKVMKAQMILVMLRMFPKDEAKAKQEYQKLIKRVDEW